MTTNALPLNVYLEYNYTENLCIYVCVCSHNHKIVRYNLVHNFTFYSSFSPDRYDHFSDKGCVLFRNEDFNPPTEPKDVDVTFDTDEDFDLFLHPKCPKCLMVRFIY